MSTHVGNSYLRDTVMQASPEQLQLMLYDGAIRFACQGREAIEQKNYEQVYEKLSRAQKIVLEMQAGLRHEVHPELCSRMAALYAFIYRKLVNASVQRNTSDVDDAVKVLRHERETWVLLLDKVARERHSGEMSTAPARSEQSASLSLQG